MEKVHFLRYSLEKKNVSKDRSLQRKIQKLVIWNRILESLKEAFMII